MVPCAEVSTVGQSGQDGSKVGSEASGADTGLSGDVQELRFHLDLELAPCLSWVLLAHLHLMVPPCWGQLMLMVVLGQCQECRPAGPTSLASSLGLLILTCYLSRQSEVYTQAGRV